MRIVAAIPAARSARRLRAAGLFCPDVPFLPSRFCVVLACCVSPVASGRGASDVASLLAAAVAVGFFAGGALLVGRCLAARVAAAAAAGVRADRARSSGAQADAEGRRLPEDDEAFAVVDGVLRADAAPTASGVSLSVDVDAD